MESAFTGVHNCIEDDCREQGAAARIWYLCAVSISADDAQYVFIDLPGAIAAIRCGLDCLAACCDVRSDFTAAVLLYTKIKSGSHEYVYVGRPVHLHGSLYYTDCDAARCSHADPAQHGAHGSRQHYCVPELGLTVQNAIDDDKRASIFSILSVLILIFISPAGLIGGWTYSIDPRLPFILIIAAFIWSAVLMLLYIRQTGKSANMENTRNEG